MASRKPRQSEIYCAVADTPLVAFNWDARWGTALESHSLAGGANYTTDENAPRPDTFRQARRWATMQEVVGKVIRVRRSFYNFGMLGQREILVNPKKPDGARKLETHPGIRALDPEKADKLEAWKQERQEDIARYFVAAWTEFLTLDNLITVWRKGGLPLVQPLEKVGYSDAFGQEQVTIRHGLTPSAVEKMNLAAPLKERFKKTELILQANDPEFGFHVVKNAPVGQGLGWPLLASVFHACAAIENLSVSDRALSDAMRTIYEQHLIGHEIKSGPMAGQKAHFISPARAEAVKKLSKSAKGHIVISTNFDHTIKVGAGLPDPTRFDSRRYASAVEALARWGAPVMQMVEGKGINPYLMPLLRQEAEDARELLRPHFAKVLSKALGCPVPFRLQWDSTIFWDSRLMLDLLKASVTGGAVSQETFRNKTGFDHADELLRKGRESELPIELKAPAWDPHHGKRPGDDTGGKPAGKGDLS